jgi:RimJ/RimL family protein N-acetyltransferase
MKIAGVEIDPDNKASQRVAERLGFERGELLKECYQRASDARVGKIEKRDQQRRYLHRLTEGLWSGYETGLVTTVPI